VDRGGGALTTLDPETRPNGRKVTMDVFVVGATGELGRPAVREMVGAGHRVRGVARSPEKAALLDRLGAEPVTVDVFDRDALAKEVDGADALLHLATRIPPTKEMRKASAWVENNRLRTELTPILVDVALERGIGTFVGESITFTYPERGDEWIDESVAVPDTTTLRSVLDLEAEVDRFHREGGRGVTLRFSLLYGPTTESLASSLEYARRRIAPVLGAANAYQSSLHTDDAGSAIAAALNAPAGVYNVSDDEPLRRREFADAFSAAFGLPHLRITPPWILRLAAGKTGNATARSQRVRNDRFKAATGWTPCYPSAREGWVATAAAFRQEHPGA
jgi:nucleoside-diphosphate-sugar epimerase